MLLAACGGNGRTEAGSGAETDTAATATDTTKSSTEESGAPVAAEKLTTPDLALLEVRGNVRQIKSENMAQEATFDKDGNLTTYGNSDRISKVRRNDKGQLTSFLGSEWTTVEWVGNYPAKIENEYNELIITSTYTYGEKGLVEKESRQQQDLIEEIDETTVYTYTYAPEDFDTHGNWLKRKAKLSDGTSHTMSRKIYYYE